MHGWERKKLHQHMNLETLVQSTDSVLCVRYDELMSWIVLLITSYMYRAYVLKELHHAQCSLFNKVHSIAVTHDIHYIVMSSVIYTSTTWYL